MSAKKLLRAEKNLLQPAVRLRAEHVLRLSREPLAIFLEINEVIRCVHRVFEQFSEDVSLSFHVRVP